MFREVIILSPNCKCIIISMCIHEDTYIHTYIYIYRERERERESFTRSCINGICPMHYPSYVCILSYMNHNKVYVIREIIGKVKDASFPARKNAKLLQIPRTANRPPGSHGGREMGRKMRRIISLYCN